MITSFRAAVCLALLAAFAADPAVALAGTARKGVQSAEAWAATIVTKITKADLDAPGKRSQGGTVTIRIRIAADGSLDGAAIEGPSSSLELDERALSAVKAASPFAPPPRGIVTLEGFTEISFPLDLEPIARRVP